MNISFRRKVYLQAGEQNLFKTGALPADVQVRLNENCLLPKDVELIWKKKRCGMQIKTFL